MEFGQRVGEYVIGGTLLILILMEMYKERKRQRQQKKKALKYLFAPYHPSNKEEDTCVTR